MTQYHTTEQLQKIEHWLNSHAFPLERLERLEENCPIIPVYINLDIYSDSPIRGVMTWGYNPITESIQINLFTESNSYYKTFACGRWIAVTTINALQAFFQQYHITYADGVLND